MSKARLVLDAKAKHGESPFWDSKKKILYWLDILSRKVHTYDTEAGVDSVYNLDILPTSLIAKSDGGFAVTSEDGIYMFDEEFLSKRFFLPLEADNESTRFNDAKADPQGRLWAGTMNAGGEPGGGSLYRIDDDRSYKEVLSPVDISNGIVWSNDSKMYYTDSLSGEIQKFDYDPKTGEITNAKVEYKFDSSIPDGMAIDSENNLWIALWGEGKVVCVDTKRHIVTETISVDAKLTSAVAFGGENLKTLYVTTSRLGMSEADIGKDPLAGGLFRFETEVKGTLFHEFIEKS